jgi:outer membrane protein assembly factor BamB
MGKSRHCVEEQELMKKSALLALLLLCMTEIAAAQGPRRVALGDWPEIRGPRRDGTSQETGLVNSWSLEGQNLLWRVPHGGRSAPIVMGNRVYLQNPSGRGAELQERVMALDADTGRTIWEYKFNMFQSDAPPHRVGWASPAADAETENIYALSGGAQVIALSRDGRLLWERSFGEEFAAFTTQGGRTMSPLIDGDLVIVSAAVSNWGTNSNRAHRFIALDKRSGEVVYVSNPGGRPYDTAYASPLIATINGVRLLIAGLGDGAVHAIRPQTGEKVWSFIAAKRAVNTGVLVQGNSVLLSHGDENLDTNIMGMIAAIDGSQAGTITATKWAVKGTEFGYSPPVSDGTRVYQIDNGSRMKAFDIATGQELWNLPLGRGQKAPPVLVDGKIYVGTEDGKFFIVRPGPDRGEILSSVELPVSQYSCCGSEGTPEQILAGAAVSRGRVFFVSSDAVYALGPRQAKSLTGWAVDEPAQVGQGAPVHLQVVPTELVLTPGKTVRFRARLFDDKGRFLREEKAAWALEGLTGTVNDGSYTVPSAPVEQAGLIKATIGGLTGTARARVARPLPWRETFESYADGAVPPGWVNAVAGKVSVATLDGQKVLRKAPDNTIFKRARVFIGPVEYSNYTFEADVRATEQRRQMGDVGITAQRYSLILFGSSQRLRLEPWEPETARTASAPFAWRPDTWYRLKLRVSNLPDGRVSTQGKVWAVGGPEPDAWMIDRVDPIGNRQGAPGLFLDAEFGVYLDNFAITPNE